MSAIDGVFTTVCAGADEARTDASYFWDNAARGDSDCLVIQRTLRGAGFFKDRRGRRLVPPGYAMLFSHREASSYGYPAEAEEPYRLRFLAFSRSSVQGLFDRIRSDFGAVVRMPNDSEATVLFEELLRAFQKRRFVDRFHESELLYRLLIALYREQVAGTRVDDPIEFGYHYLRNHFRSPISLKVVAESCGVTREHFIRMFTRRYRVTPGVMLRQLRLDYARGILSTTELPVEEVALRCGYADSNTFRHAYKAKFGRNPGKERRRSREARPPAI